MARLLAMSKKIGNNLSVEQKVQAINNAVQKFYRRCIEKAKALTRALLTRLKKVFNLFLYLLYFSLVIPFRRRGKVIGLLTVFVMSLVIIWRNQEWLVRNKEFLDFSLTLTLIFVTTIYVYLTYRIVFYQSEVQRSGHQPLIYTELIRQNAPEVDVPVEEFGNELIFKLSIKNIGKGPALDLKVSYEHKAMFFHRADIVTTSRRISSILECRESVDMIIDLSATLDVYREVPNITSVADFLSIDYEFHDRDRNFFLYRQEYSFFKASYVHYQNLHLEKESLWRVSAQEIMAMDTRSVSIIASEQRPLFVRERKKPLYEKIGEILEGKFPS